MMNRGEHTKRIFIQQNPLELHIWTALAICIVVCEAVDYDSIRFDSRLLRYYPATPRR